MRRRSPLYDLTNVLMAFALGAFARHITINTEDRARAEANERKRRAANLQAAVKPAAKHEYDKLDLDLLLPSEKKGKKAKKKKSEKKKKKVTKQNLVAYVKGLKIAD